MKIEEERRISYSWISYSLISHEQLNSFLMKHNLSAFHKLDVAAIIDRAKEQHVELVSTTVVTAHHLALLYTCMYNLEAL